MTGRIKQRNKDIAIYATPYKFNGKELDEETGLYYYGARYMHPKYSMWLSTDPLERKYPNVNSYCYAKGNQLSFIDRDGRLIIFINGKIGGGSPLAGESYWNKSFVSGAKAFFGDNNVYFSNNDYGYFSTARGRENEGYEYAKKNYPTWVNKMNDGESFKLVSHSMGAAFSKGVEKYIKEQGDRNVDYNVMINSYQINKIRNEANNNVFDIDYQNTNDPVLFLFDPNLGKGKLKNAELIIREKSTESIRYIHRSPIDGGSRFWNTIKENIEIQKNNQKE